jgi:hypothetical protein
VSSTGRSQADVDEDLGPILRDGIDDKEAKLQQVNLPSILVLEDQYLLSSPAVWIDHLHNYPQSYHRRFAFSWVRLPHQPKKNIESTRKHERQSNARHIGPCCCTLPPYLHPSHGRLNDHNAPSSSQEASA